MDKFNLLTARREFSDKTISDLREEILKISIIQNFEDRLCIYVTGSFARGEASKFSDIDIFFINKGPIKNLDFILLQAELIKIVKKLDLPDFSGDGEYLTSHEITEILQKLGSPEDDYKNYFTARMLLLLESKPLFNESLYNEVIYDIINVYYNDYAKHETNFKPIFLANDVIRFWKTMCLNYEEKRKRHENDKSSKYKYRLKNLKLKFSRLTTCYSLLSCLTKAKQSTPDDLHELVLKTPIERLKFAQEMHSDALSIITEMLQLYEWFLKVTENEPDKLFEWIKSPKNKNLAFRNAETFHDYFYQLIQLTSKDLLKYYTI